jgi:hypothetical protein
MPFASLPNRCGEQCPRLLINREEVGSFAFNEEGNYRDVFAAGECDEQVAELARLCGWEGELLEVHRALLQRKMQSREVDQHLADLPPSVTAEAERLGERWKRLGEITAEQAKAVLQAVESRAPDVIKAYTQFMETGDPGGWEDALRAVARCPALKRV